MGGYSSPAAALRPTRKGSEITITSGEHFLGGALRGSAILAQLASNTLHNATQQV